MLIPLLYFILGGIMGGGGGGGRYCSGIEDGF